MSNAENPPVWFDGSVKPETADMYERDTSCTAEVSDSTFNYFDGLFWRIGDASIHTCISSTLSSYQSLRWRYIRK